MYSYKFFEIKKSIIWEKIFIIRDKFDEITSALLDETLKKTEEAIEAARKKGYGKIDEILLVSGSTRMPQAKKALTQKFSESKSKWWRKRTKCKGL